jgi:hypothetical protein
MHAGLHLIVPYGRRGKYPAFPGEVSLAIFLTLNDNPVSCAASNFAELILGPSKGSTTLI